MFEFVFAGELLPFIVNGDRFVLFALLPRRQPRTDRTVQLPYWPFHDLNLTSSRLLRFACPFGGWPGFLLWGPGLPNITPRNTLRDYRPLAGAARRLRVSVFGRLAGGGFRFHLQSTIWQQVPKPMTEVEVAGELLPYTVNGDRNVPIAL